MNQMMKYSDQYPAVLVSSNLSSHTYHVDTLENVEKPEVNSRERNKLVEHEITVQLGEVKVGKVLFIFWVIF